MLYLAPERTSVVWEKGENTVARRYVRKQQERSRPGYENGAVNPTSQSSRASAAGDSAEMRSSASSLNMPMLRNKLAPHSNVRESVRMSFDTMLPPGLCRVIP